MVTSKVIARGTELKSIDLGSMLNKIDTLLEEDDCFLILEEDEFDVLTAWEGLKLTEGTFVFRKVF